MLGGFIATSVTGQQFKKGKKIYVKNYCQTLTPAMCYRLV